MLPLSHPGSAFHISGHRQAVSHPVGPGNLSLFSFFPARVAWCLSRTLRGHLSRSDAIVGTVGPFCALVTWRDHREKGDASLSAGDSQYPLSTAYRLRMGSAMSREPPSDSPVGCILRNGKNLTLKISNRRGSFSFVTRLGPSINWGTENSGLLMAH